MGQGQFGIRAEKVWHLGRGSKSNQEFLIDRRANGHKGIHSDVQRCLHASKMLSVYLSLDSLHYHLCQIFLLFLTLFICTILASKQLHFLTLFICNIFASIQLRLLILIICAFFIPNQLRFLIFFICSSLFLTSCV